MQCVDLMKTAVECVSPRTTIRDAARKMRDQNIGFLPVCDEERRAVGALTDRDIAIRAVADALPPSTRVEEILSSEVIACRPEEPVENARDLMTRHQKSRVMCIDRSGRIQGVISLSDIVQLDDEGGARALLEITAREARRGAADWALPI